MKLTPCLPLIVAVAATLIHKVDARSSADYKQAAITSESGFEPPFSMLSLELQRRAGSQEENARLVKRQTPGQRSERLETRSKEDVNSQINMEEGKAEDEQLETRGSVAHAIDYSFGQSADHADGFDNLFKHRGSDFFVLDTSQSGVLDPMRSSVDSEQSVLTSDSSLASHQVTKSSKPAQVKPKRPRGRPPKSYPDASNEPPATAREAEVLYYHLLNVLRRVKKKHPENAAEISKALDDSKRAYAHVMSFEENRRNRSAQKAKYYDFRKLRVGYSAALSQGEAAGIRFGGRKRDASKTGEHDDPDWLNDEQRAALSAADLKKHDDRMSQRRRALRRADTVFKRFKRKGSRTELFAGSDELTRMKRVRLIQKAVRMPDTAKVTPSWILR